PPPSRGRLGGRTRPATGCSLPAAACALPPDRPVEAAVQLDPPHPGVPRSPKGDGGEPPQRGGREKPWVPHARARPGASNGWGARPAAPPPEPVTAGPPPPTSPSAAPRRGTALWR